MKRSKALNLIDELLTHLMVGSVLLFFVVTFTFIFYRMMKG